MQYTEMPSVDEHGDIQNSHRISMRVCLVNILEESSCSPTYEHTDVI